MSTIEQISALVEPLCAAAGVELYDVELAGPILRVLVEREGGIDVDTLSSLSRAVSESLDESDPIEGRYTLEVSSPGLERPLRSARHFEAVVGQRVKLRTGARADGPRRVDGTLVAVEDGGDTLVVESVDDGARHQVPRSAVERARTVFVWGPAERPVKVGSGAGSKRKGSGS